MRSDSPYVPAVRPLLGIDERLAVERVLQSGTLAQGAEVAAFESEFARIVGDRRCVAVNSGTSALHLALLAMGINLGDEVIVPSFTFAATANAVCLAGATPVFVDIDPATYCLDPVAAEAAVTPRTRVILPVHLYGHPAAMTDIEVVAKRYALAIVEDAAQAHGAFVHGVPVGAWGVAAAFSFYPTKNMTSGEGGMVCSDDERLRRTVRLLRNQGMERPYENEVVGFNMRMSDIHASIGRVQLSKLAGWTSRRQANASLFNDHLEGVILPHVAPGAVHVFHQYTIRVPDHNRDAFVSALEARGIGSGIYYPRPVHRLAPFRASLDLPETERAAREVISLPVYPSLTEAELHRIIEAVNAVATAGA